MVEAAEPITSAPMMRTPEPKRGKRVDAPTAGAPGFAEVVEHALVTELGAQPHGPVQIWTFAGDIAVKAMDEMGVHADSPARAFLADHPDGVLVVATAEVPA